MKVTDHIRILSEELSDRSVVFNVRWDNGVGGEIEFACMDESHAHKVAGALAALEADFVSFEVM